MAGLIKSKARVRDHGEVFTAAREVRAMLDLVKEEASAIDSTFLEPACGNGNFLAEILRRKMTSVFTMAPRNSADGEYLLTRAAASIYGVDIQEDNVYEARERLFDSLFAGFVNHYKHKPSQICLDSIRFILSQNIQCGDTLTCQRQDGSPLYITQWCFDNANGLTIHIYDYLSMVASGCSCNPVHSLPRIPYLLLPTIIRHN